MNTQEAIDAHAKAQADHDSALSSYGEAPTPSAWAKVESAEREIKKAAAVLSACRKRDADAAAAVERARLDAIRDELAAAVALAATHDAAIAAAVERLASIEGEAQALIDGIRADAHAAAKADETANALRLQIGEREQGFKDGYHRSRVAKGHVADRIRAMTDRQSEVAEWLVRGLRPSRTVTANETRTDTIVADASLS